MFQLASPFMVEGNVLIGEKDPIGDDCKNIGESILNAFKSRPDFVGQVYDNINLIILIKFILHKKK